MNNLQKNLYPPPNYINTPQQPLVNPYPIQMPSNNITPNINVHHPPVSGQNNQYFYQQPNYDNYYNEPANYESTRYYQPKQYQPPEIPLNIVQKISFIIKSQLSYLQKKENSSHIKKSLVQDPEIKKNVEENILGASLRQPFNGCVPNALFPIMNGGRNARNVMSRVQTELSCQVLKIGDVLNVLIQIMPVEISVIDVKHSDKINEVQNIQSIKKKLKVFLITLLTYDYYHIFFQRFVRLVNEFQQSHPQNNFKIQPYLQVTDYTLANQLSLSLFDLKKYCKTYIFNVQKIIVYFIILQLNMTIQTRPKVQKQNVPITKQIEKTKKKKRLSRKTRIPRGRPPVPKAENFQQDQKYTEQVINIIKAYLQYTEEVGLKHGFFLNESQNDEISTESLDEVQEEQLKNLIQMTSYSMDITSAKEFKKLYCMIYELLKQGKGERQTLQIMTDVITQTRKSEFTILTLVSEKFQENVRKQFPQKTKGLVLFVLTIIEEINKLIKKRD